MVSVRLRVGVMQPPLPLYMAVTWRFIRVVEPGLGWLA